MLCVLGEDLNCVVVSVAVQDIDFAGVPSPDDNDVGVQGDRRDPVLGPGDGRNFVVVVLAVPDLDGIVRRPADNDVGVHGDRPDTICVPGEGLN